MKVLHIINSLGTGGAEKLLLDTLPLYRQAGIEADVLLLWDNDLPFTRALRELNCCTIHILKKSPHIRHIYNPLSLFKMSKYLKMYDIAHVHLFPAQYFAVFANRLNGNRTRLLFTEHNTTNRRIKWKIFRPVETFVYSRYHKIICITEEIRDIYARYLNNHPGLTVIPNGVDLSGRQKTAPLDKREIASDLKETDVLLTQVAAFRKQKDQPTLIRAMRHLPEHFKLLLAGTGDLRKDCRKLAQELGVQERVYFSGHRMDIPALLKTSDFVVLSSHYEGLSLASIEGMASGRPFIGSDVPGLREAVHGAGELFEAGNDRQLAEIILALYNDRDRYNKTAARCMERAGEYDIRKMVSRHIELYPWKPRLIRTATVPLSLNLLLRGQLEYLNRYFDVTALSGSGPDMDETSRREKVKTHSIEMRRNIAPLHDLISLWKLYRYFRKERPQIVHSITPKAGLLSMVAARAAGVPVRMHTFTGLIFPSRTGLIQKLLITMDRLLCRAATHVYPEGNGVRNDLIRYKITAKPLKVLANGNINGIDPERFSPDRISEKQKQALKQQLGIRPDDFVFVFVGRLTTEKGVNELVEAFGRLTCACVKLLLVGPQEPGSAPLHPGTLQKMEAGPDIISTGFQSDVFSCLALSDVLVLPSYREGFPNGVMQAGAMGLPCIVTDINGSNEIITDGKNGIIIPAKNTAALQKAMETLVTDREYYRRLAQNARPMIVSRYQQQLVWNALLTEYTQAQKESSYV